MLNLVYLIPLLPLIGFTIIGLGNKKLPKILVSLIGCGTILGSFIIVLSLLLGLINGSIPTITTIPYFDWIYAGNVRLGMSFLIDPLSVMMMAIITGVGFLIHLYSVGYMSHDEGYARYFTYLNLFVFSMLLLVMGSNFVVMFAGWEGVGLCSYLLIGFWFKNTNYNNAAKKAFIMNRVGDLGFLLGMILIFVTFGSLNYSDVFAQAPQILKSNSGIVIAITLLLFIGATGKSAQIPLYTWLPDAMAGPTPVSALIHAATMVTAGIYMIVRSNVLYTLAPFTLEVVMIVGISTALFAATIGLVQNDIKKVLAYSTVSQLGYMFFALGLGAYTTGMFHVTTHAFFKALLFLGAGSVIHAMSGEQDIRNMGGLVKKLPITFFTFLIATIAIAGIPPFAGFFSKDEILAHAYEKSPILWGLGVAGALMTAFYMFRLLFLTFFGTFRGTEEQKHHLHESPLIMTIPLMVLAVLSTIGGFIGLPELLGGSNWLAHYLSPVISKIGEKEVHTLSHSTEYMLMGISTLLVVIMIIVAAIIYIGKKAIPVADDKEAGIQKVLSHKYYIDELYQALFVKPLELLSSFFGKVIDHTIIDGIVNGVGRGVEAGSRMLRYTQSGSISMYLFAMVIGIILILVINLLK
ncbi:MAG TPA: NADH-quinone oxidoreductase subunit L [Cytophagaceae bacterium]|jgi:NADH-quinone oxidoreductase subunit L|nr:NADH-quinone oxidoreductase subunit L [Cytophagaceae bacterium]